MATLEEAAEALVKKIGLFTVDDTLATLQHLKEEAEKAQKDLQGDWDSFLEAVFSLLEQVEEQEKSLLDETKEAGEALAKLPAAVKDTADDLEKAVGEAFGAVEALAQSAEKLGPELGEQIDKKAGDAADALAKQAEGAATEMGKKLDELTTAVTDGLGGELGDAQGLAQLFGDAAKNIPLSASRTLAALFEEWAARVAEVSDDVKNKGFDLARGHGAKAADAAMQECEETHQASFGEMWPLLESANNYLDALRSQVEYVRDGAKEHEPKLAEGADDLKAAIATAVTELHKVSEFLAAHGFMPR